MPNEDRSSRAELRIGSPSPPPADGGNLSIESEPPEPPPGSVSALRLTDGVIEAAKDRIRDGVIPTLPEIPTWVLLLGAAVSGTIAYGAWRLLVVTAPVLVPAALGLPPATGLALQQLGAGKQGGAPSFADLSALLTPRATQLGGAPPEGAQAPNANVGALLAMLPTLGAQVSATAQALSSIASTARSASAPPSSEAPTRPRRPPAAPKPAPRSKVDTLVSAS